jgi:hypothetical protein
MRGALSPFSHTSSQDDPSLSTRTLPFNMKHKYSLQNTPLEDLEQRPMLSIPLTVIVSIMIGNSYRRGVDFRLGHDVIRSAFEEGTLPETLNVTGSGT